MVFIIVVVKEEEEENDTLFVERFRMTQSRNLSDSATVYGIW